MHLQQISRTEYSVGVLVVMGEYGAATLFLGKKQQIIEVQSLINLR